MNPMVAILILLQLLCGTAQAGETIMTEKATFAGGCFWGIEKIFGELEGVTSTRVGYTGGAVKNPGYELVCSGLTGHAEAIELEYDPSIISYDELVEFFFTHHDPTALNRQGNDIGTQYRSAIFYHSPEQKAAGVKAVAFLEEAKIFKKPVATTLEPAGEFYAAEEYHQKYLKKNPGGYCHIQLQSKKIGEVLQAARAR
jgi:peptide-methionine (S)-S-oxide reductase